jgi:hypothetical protein
MRWHSRIRASSWSYALTFAASEGSGIGSVLIQWLTRNRGARSGPRLGLQLAASWLESLSCATFVNLKGVSSVMLPYASRYQGAPPAWFSARKTRRRLESIIWRRVGSVSVIGPS